MGKRLGLGQHNQECYDHLPLEVNLILLILLCFDLLTRLKMPFKVMHRKEVIRSNGS